MSPTKATPLADSLFPGHLHIVLPFMGNASTPVTAESECVPCQVAVVL